MTDTHYTIPTVRGEALVKGVSIPANGRALFDFEVIANGGLSWFNIHRELGGGATALAAALLNQAGEVLESAAGWELDSNTPHCRHTGAPYKVAYKCVELAPGHYTYALTALDGRAHSGLVVGRQNGGNVAGT